MGFPRQESWSGWPFPSGRAEQKIEVLPPAETGVTELRITGQRQDGRGLLTDQLFRLLSAMDAPLRQLVPEKDDLESVFLEVTA